MKFKNHLPFLFMCLCLTINAQTSNLIINPDIEMPKDSLAGKALLFSVTSFLNATQEESENKWIVASERMETELLIEEMQDIQRSEELENDSFFKPYLTNITPLEDDTYGVHIAYIGIKDEAAILRANFEFIAQKSNDVFLISSPLKRNTRNWKTKSIQNQVFHYPYTLDTEKVQRFYELTSFFDQNLKNTAGVTHYYLSSEVAPLKLFGVEYKSDYNGEKLVGRWGASEDKTSLFVMTADKFYNYPEHDLWHFRLGQVISRREVHRRVDCHYGTLYGGLWGKSWEELFPLFSEEYVVGTNIDWLEHKKASSHFVINGRKNYSDDFVGALLLKKIEKEKGFDGVWKLMKTKRTKDEAEYFATLEDLTGITKENYNKEVFKLIEEEMSHLGIKVPSK